MINSEKSGGNWGLNPKPRHYNYAHCIDNEYWKHPNATRYHPAPGDIIIILLIIHFDINHAPSDMISILEWYLGISLICMPFVLAVSKQKESFLVMGYICRNGSMVYCLCPADFLTPIWSYATRRVNRDDLIGAVHVGPMHRAFSNTYVY